MIPIKCFDRDLVQEAMGVLAQGNSLVRWFAGERGNELHTRLAWSKLESCLHRNGSG